jgi:hypothetical protein
MTATRVMRGAISLSSSSHFALRVLECGKSGHVAAGLRQVRDEASTDGITHVYKYNRDGARGLL